MQRIGLVVHPRREIGRALASLQAWSDDRGIDVVQVPTGGQDRAVATAGEADGCDLVVSLGGDGTTLAALRTAAAAGKPVLGVACGSLGALTATSADRLVEGLERIAAGDWSRRTLPALAVQWEGEPLWALNDLVLVREGAGQLSASVFVDDELYIRFGGDGVVVATPLGSSAYTLAAGGPVLAPGSTGMVVTPLAPHGGCCPPLVAGAQSVLRVLVDPAHGGARIEIDGQGRGRVAPHEPQAFSVRWSSEHATLVELGGEEPFLAGLRRRRILMDSPRMLARDDRNPVQGV